MMASLVICTRDRAARLPRCLESLDKLDRSGVEIVFVDNGSRDDTTEVLLTWARSKPDIQVVHESKPGLGRARNTGWIASRGEIVVFTDDDCYPMPDYVQRHILLYGDNPRLGWITGRILLFDQSDARITIQENTQTVHYPAREFLSTGSVHGANISFRRTALEAIGGFDPLMGVGAFFSCEDIDAAARACYSGFEGLYSPLPSVYHHHGRQTSEQVRSLESDYRKGRGAYYAKCLATPSMRSEYLRRVLGKWRRQPFVETRDEALAILKWFRKTHLRNSNIPS